MTTTIYIHGTTPSSWLYVIPAIKLFFSCPPGLTPVGSLGKEYHHRHLLEALSQASPSKFPSSSFYVYGWSGKLSTVERYKEAMNLFEALKSISGPVRIITHSHGGNIALQLAQAAGDQLVIEELILLACPVQRFTMNYVTRPIFKKVYSFHSHVDIFQVLDPQGFYELSELYEKSGLSTMFSSIQKMESFFSSRHFAVSEHLRQINVLQHGRGLFHMEFMLSSFMRLLPALLEQVEETQSQFLGDEVVIDCGSLNNLGSFR